MRTLNDIFLPMGEMTAIGTIGNAPSHAVVAPDRGEIIGAHVYTVDTVDADTTIDVLKNGADTAAIDGTAADILVPSALGGGEGVFCILDKEVHVEEGDLIDLTSNGECTATIGAISLVLRR